MSSIHKPQRRADIQAINRPGEQALYDPKSEIVHELNPTSMAIWEACDGETTRDELVSAISKLTGMSSETALEDVTDALSTFERLELLEHH